MLFGFSVKEPQLTEGVPTMLRHAKHARWSTEAPGQKGFQVGLCAYECLGVPCMSLTRFKWFYASCACVQASNEWCFSVRIKHQRAVPWVKVPKWLLLLVCVARVMTHVGGNPFCMKWSINGRRTAHLGMAADPFRMRAKWVVGRSLQRLNLVLCRWGSSLRSSGHKIRGVTFNGIKAKGFSNFKRFRNPRYK